MAQLRNRFGRRIGALSALTIELPVGRSGARFQALLPSDVLQGLDTARLRYFVIEDDAGNRFPAIIDHVAAVPQDARTSAIRGVVVASGGI